MTIRHPSSERLIRFARPHWVTHVFPVFLAVVLLTASVVLLLMSGMALTHQSWIAAVAFFGGLSVLLITLHWFFVRMLSDSMEQILITDKRIVHLQLRLLLHEMTHEISFEKMKTVSATKNGFLQNVLSYGSLKFEGGSEVRYVAHPNAVVKDIEQAMGLR